MADRHRDRDNPRRCPVVWESVLKPHWIFQFLFALWSSPRLVGWERRSRSSSHNTFWLLGVALQLGGSLSRQLQLALSTVPWSNFSLFSCTSMIKRKRSTTSDSNVCLLVDPKWRRDDDVLSSVNFQDDDPKLDKASSAGRRTGRKWKATGGINASLCTAQARGPSLGDTSKTSAQTKKINARSMSLWSTSKKIYPSVQAQLLIQLEQLEGEATAVHDSIMKSTDGFQCRRHQKHWRKPRSTTSSKPLVLRTSCRRWARMKLRILEFVALLRQSQH